jgi:hypothetical protein
MATLTRSRVAAVLVAALLVLAWTSNVGAFRWFSTRVLQSSAIADFGGAPILDETGGPRYSVSYLTDDLAADATCIAVVSDLRAGTLSATTVPPASCQARGAGRLP